MKRNLALLAWLLVLSTAASGENLKQGYFTIVYSKAYVIADIRINGIPVVEPGSAGSLSGQLDVNYWIAPGKNTITVRLTEQNRKDDAGYFSPRCSVSLYIAQKGQFPDEGKLVAKYEFPAAGAAKTSYPVSQTITFVPEFTPPSDLWEKAAEAALTPQDEAEIGRLLAEYEAAFNARDLERFRAIIDFRAMDTSKSRYYPVTRDAVTAMIKSLFSDPTAKVKNTAGGKYVFVKLFGGKIYRRYRRGRQSPGHDGIQRRHVRE